jgi:AraC family transcriptional regulator, dual regulator of chb operon
MNIQRSAPMFSDEKPFGIFKNIFLPGEAYPAHTHEYFEIALLCEGELTQWIAGEKFECSPQSLCLVRPNDLHILKNLHSKKRTYLINCPFSTQLFDEVMSEINHWTKHVFHEKPLVLPKVSSRRWESWIDRILELEQERSLGAGFAVAEFKALLSEIFLLILNQPVSLQVPKWFLEACEQMELQKNFVLGLPRLLEIVDCTQEHLTRTFKKHLGLSPTNYINRLRIREAAAMLTMSDKPLWVVMEECGFHDISHFRRCFASIYGITPGRYAKSKQQRV